MSSKTTKTTRAAKTEAENSATVGITHGPVVAKIKKATLDEMKKFAEMSDAIHREIGVIEVKKAGLLTQLTKVSREIDNIVGKAFYEAGCDASKGRYHIDFEKGLIHDDSEPRR